MGVWFHHHCQAIWKCSTVSKNHTPPQKVKSYPPQTHTKRTQQILSAALIILGTHLQQETYLVNNTIDSRTSPLLSSNEPPLAPAMQLVASPHCCFPSPWACTWFQCCLNYRWPKATPTPQRHKTALPQANYHKRATFPPSTILAEWVAPPPWEVTVNPTIEIVPDLHSDYLEEIDISHSWVAEYHKQHQSMLRNDSRAWLSI